MILLVLTTLKAPKCLIKFLEKLRRDLFWKKVCSPTLCGGLRIGGLQASNLGMPTKWWWRFLNKKNSFWHNVIVSIHGIDGGLAEDSIAHRHFRALGRPSLISPVLLRIIKEIR